MKVHFKTLGCRLNEAETELWADKFQASGHQVVNGTDPVDVIVLNSCAVTLEAVRKSRRVIRKLRRENPRAKLVVSGCYATLNHQQVTDSLGVDLVVDNANKDRLVELASKELALEIMPEITSQPGEVALFNRGRQRAFIKVQDGCRYRCSYCIVTVARGEERSRPIEDIVAQINGLHDQGINEIVLTGVHLGGYGSDLKTDLACLIKAVLDKTSIPRIRLGSLEPWDLSESFFRLFENQRFMPHLHLPLQSGSDSVLRRMARRCTTNEFTLFVEIARAIRPEMNITTDIIVGFPGESEKEWAETLTYVEPADLGHIHIFAYSPRQGTKAAEMSDQVPVSIKKRRSKELHRLAESMTQKTYRRFLESTVEILWEGQGVEADSRPTKVMGYTPNYIRVATMVENGEQLENTIKPARLVAVDPSNDFITAELV